jgi:hypothetical protein
MRKLVRLFSAVVFLYGILIPLAKADSVSPMTSGAGANDYVDWSQTWQVDGKSFNVTSNNGVGVNVSFPRLLTNYMARVNDWGTDNLLYVTDPIKFKFDEGISAVGAHIWFPRYHGVNYVSYFSALMMAYDSTGTLLGRRLIGGDGTGMGSAGTFLGLEDSTGPNIDYVTLSVGYYTVYNWTDFEVGTLYLNSPSAPEAPTVPEPSTLLLFASGMAGFAGLIRTRFSCRC